MKQLLFLFGILTFGLVTNAQSEGNDPERFYNVESYKANITITYIYSLSEKTSNTSKLINASQTFQHFFKTAPGQISTADMFQIERGDKADGESQKKGMMKGVDMDAVSQAMKNSGLDPSVMDQLKKTKRETGSYDMGLGKYKMWMFNGVTGGEVSSSIYTKFSSKAKEKQGPCGEVLGRGEDNDYTRYGGEAQADSGNPNMNNKNSFILQLNFVNNSYSFSTDVDMLDGFKFTGTDHDEDCGIITDKEISMSARSFISIKSDKEGLIYKKPLPDNGMVLSGSEIITDKFSIGQDKEGANWSVKIDWTISPAD